jgi:acyl homoserine lactone synthase
MQDMLQFNAGARQQLPPHIFEQIGQYRREVFINRLGWELHTLGGLELDEFDGPDAVYVSCHDDSGDVNGVARLLPTTVPYLMEKVFPALWAGGALPHDAQIWELSRFAAMDLSKPSNLPTHQVSSAIAPDFLRQVMQTAKSRGAHTLITVSPVGIERLLRVNGFKAKRAGIPQLFGPTPITALQIDLNI